MILDLLPINGAIEKRDMDEVDL